MNILSLCKHQQQKTRSQAEKFLQSFEGLNSSLAYSSAELWPCANEVLYIPG